MMLYIIMLYLIRFIQSIIISVLAYNYYIVKQLVKMNYYNILFNKRTSIFMITINIY